MVDLYMFLHFRGTVCHTGFSKWYQKFQFWISNPFTFLHCGIQLHYCVCMSDVTRLPFRLKLCSSRFQECGEGIGYFSSLLLSHSALWWISSCALLAIFHLGFLELRGVLPQHRGLQPHQWNGQNILRPSAPGRHSGLWRGRATWPMSCDLRKRLVYVSRSSLCM